MDAVSRVALLLIVVVTAACGKDGPRVEVGDDDEIICPAGLPPPSDECLAGQCGNELGVGQPCTKGGGECDVYDFIGGEAAICIPDFADYTNVEACSKACSVDDDCGTGAVCAPDPFTDRLGCVIAACEGR
ncbi:MAG TPA: hypothetical protein VGF99_09270 [Myxococcota bacterium]